MPIYPKGKGKWRVVVFHKGKRSDWVVTGSKRDAADFEAGKRLEGAQERRAVPTFSAFSTTTYKAHAKAHLKPSTWRNRKYQIATLVEHLGERRLDEITPADVEAFKDARLDAGVRPATINDDIKVLSAILAYARELGYRSPMPTTKRLPQRGTRRGAEAWSDEEVGRLMAAVQKKSPEILPLVVFLANTGCREGEALALRWEHVDLERRIIRLRATEEWQPKSGKPREVTISDALLPWLGGPRRSERWVFPTRLGSRYAFWPVNLFNRARKAAQLTGGPHKLRHTFASHFLASTPDLYLLAQVMGHTHTRVTELYSSLLPEHLARARNAVSFSPAIGPAELAAKLKWGIK